VRGRLAAGSINVSGVFSPFFFQRKNTHLIAGYVISTVMTPEAFIPIAILWHWVPFTPLS